MKHYQFTWKQNYLFKRALYGLRGVPNHIIINMTPEEKQIVYNQYKKTRELLNQWKKDIYNNTSHRLFGNLIQNSKFAKDLLTTDNYEEVEELSLTDFGISKTQLIQKLVDNEILPKNFYYIE